MWPRGLPPAFLRTTFVNFFFFLNFASFFLLPLHVRALGGSEATVGAVVGTAGIASLLSLPFVGSAIDRIGARRFLLLGTGTMGLAALGYLFVDELDVRIFVLRVVQGASFAAAFTAATTFAAELAPPGRRAAALGVFGLSTLLTHALAPVLGEELVRRGGFGRLFATAAGFAFLAFALALALPRREGSATRRPESKARFARLQWVLAFTMVFAGMGFGTVVTFVPTFVRSENLGRVGAFFAAYTATAILVRVVGAGLSDAVGRRAVILPTLFALASSIFLLAFVRSRFALTLTGGLFGISQGLSYPTLHAFLVDLSDENQLGKAQALFNGSFNFGVTAGSFLFGWVAELYGHRPMFLAASLTPLLGWAILYRFGRSSAPVRLPSTVG
ncbi:MAG: MFS transporter [Candidatus Binatia bacterium]|nr:MAG: MFS transporter [Candidatus Binatia bacterium]